MKIRFLALMAASFVLFTGCATTEPKKREAKVKSAAPKNYGLYTARDIDPKMLKRGEQVRWSRSLDGY